MSRPITISLENLNSLYFKFINQFVLQYLPKDTYNDVVNLLSLKSAVQTYRYLDKLLGSVQDKKGLSFGEDKRLLNLAQERKGNSEVETIKEIQRKSQMQQQKSSQSNQGSTSYVDKDDFKYQSELNTIKKPPTLLKRTQTYQSPQKPSSTLIYQSYNFGQTRQNKQQPTHNNNHKKQTINLTKSPLNPTTNVVKHDYDTVSEKHNSLGVVHSGKRESRDQEQIRSNMNTVGESYSFKDHTKGRESKQKSDENLSTNNGYRKTEFSKTYSIRQPESKLLTTSANISNLTNNSPSASITNRVRFQNLIKQTKQIFSENAKKIARYEKISTAGDGTGQKLNQQQKTGNDSTTSPFSPQSGNSYAYMYRKY